MDPDANLREQLEVSRGILEAWDDCNADGTLTSAQAEFVADEANRLAELIESLDNWIRKGGFIPARWRKS